MGRYISGKIKIFSLKVSCPGQEKQIYYFKFEKRSLYLRIIIGKMKLKNKKAWTFLFYAIKDSDSSSSFYSPQQPPVENLKEVVGTEVE